jgi:hypothetical protein
VQFADGRAARVLRTSEDPDSPTAAAIRPTFWVQPLPPPGPVTLSCDWPPAGIPLTRYVIDARTILNAVAHRD